MSKYEVKDFLGKTIGNVTVIENPSNPSKFLQPPKIINTHNQNQKIIWMDEPKTHCTEHGIK